MKTNDTAKSLLELAQEKFSPLSAAEEKLLLAVPQGALIAPWVAMTTRRFSSRMTR